MPALSRPSTTMLLNSYPVSPAVHSILHFSKEDLSHHALIQGRDTACMLSSKAATPKTLEVRMYVITGITGQVGGPATMALLDAGLPGRAVEDATAFTERPGLAPG